MLIWGHTSNEWTVAITFAPCWVVDKIGLEFLSKSVVKKYKNQIQKNKLLENISRVKRNSTVLKRNAPVVDYNALAACIRHRLSSCWIFMRFGWLEECLCFAFTSSMLLLRMRDLASPTACSASSCTANEECVDECGRHTCSPRNNSQRSTTTPKSLPSSSSKGETTLFIHF